MTVARSFATEFSAVAPALEGHPPDFDHFESHPAVVARLIPAIPSMTALSRHNRGSPDKPGHDREEMAGVSI